MSNKVILEFIGDAHDLHRTFRQVEDDSDRLGSRFKFMSKSFAGLGSTGAVVNFLTLAAHSVADLSMSALLLPGAVAVGGAALGTFSMITKGFSDALTGSAKKQAAAIAAMGPEARKLVSTIKALGPEFNALRKSVQDTGVKGLSADVKVLAGIYLPMLRSHLPRIASEFNAMGRSVAFALSRPAAVNDVNEVLISTTGMMARMRNAAGHLTSALLGLAGVGARFFEKWGTGADSAAYKFKRWVDAGVESGRIITMIQTALNEFKALGTVIYNVGSILYTVFSALNGTSGTLFGVLAATTTQIRIFLKSAEGQTALIALGQAMQAASTVMSEVLSVALENLIPLIVAFLPLVSAWAQTWGTVLVGAIQTLAPLLKTITEFMAEHPRLATFLVVSWMAWHSVMSVLGTPLLLLGIALRIFGGAAVWAAARMVFAGAAMLAWQAIMFLAANAMNVLRVAMLALNIVFGLSPIGLAVIAITALVVALIWCYDNIGWFRDMVDTAFTFIKTAIASAADWVVNAWNNVVAFFQAAPANITAAFNSMVAWFQALPGVIGGALATAGQAVLDFLIALPGMIAYGLGYLAGLVYLGALAAWNFLFTTLPEIVNGKLIPFLLTLPGIVLNWLAGVAATVASAARAAWNWLVTTFVAANVALGAWLAALPGRVAGFLASLPGVVANAARNAWTGFFNFTVSAANNTMNFIRGLPGRIMGFFAGAGSWLVNAGRMIVEGLWNGLKSMAQGVLDWISNLGARVAQGFRDATGIASPSKVFAEIGGQLGQGLIVGLGDITPNVIQSAVLMTDKMTAAASTRVVPSPEVFASAPGSPVSGDAPHEVTFKGNVDSAFATAFMKLQREGKIVIA